MREKEIILIYQYIMNRQLAIEDELRELQQRMRFRNASINDSIEYILIKQRLETFIEVTSDIVTLLKLNNYKDFEL